MNINKTFSLLAAALALSTTAQAAGLEGVNGYAQIGFSDISAVDDGLAVKVGGDFAKNLGAVKGLGLTTFIAHWGGDSRGTDINGTTIAVGPTFDLLFPNSQLSFQGRAFLSYSRVKLDIPAPLLGSRSDGSIDIGLGFGGAYKINERMSVRVDYDLISADVSDGDILTAGIGYKF